MRNDENPSGLLLDPVWKTWKSSPTGIWRTSKTHFSGLFFRPSKRGSSGGAGRLFLYLKKAKTTVFLGLKTTHYYLFHFLGYGYPPHPPRGANGGGPFWPGVVGSSLCFGPPPHPGGTPPTPPFWGYPDLRSPLLPDQIWRCSHRSSFRYNYYFSSPSDHWLVRVSYVPIVVVSDTSQADESCWRAHTTP